MRKKPTITIDLADFETLLFASAFVEAIEEEQKVWSPLIAARYRLKAQWRQTVAQGRIS